MTEEPNLKQPPPDEPPPDVEQFPVEAEEPPPFGRSWGTLYAVVLVTLAVLIVLFYRFTRAFS